MVAQFVQVLDGKPYNRKCDVYSFGICLWEIYCCDMPYPDLSFAEVSSAVVRQVCFFREFINLLLLITNLELEVSVTRIFKNVKQQP